MWPFAGVMVAILFILMGSVPPPHYHLWVPTDLPQSVYAASRPKATREDAVRITLTRDGSVFYRNTRVWPGDLPDLIRKSEQEGSERRVYLAADARARYGDVKMVMDCIGQAGIRDVTILANKMAPADTVH
jgi:biopolymer transport protein ExbD